MPDFLKLYRYSINGISKCHEIKIIDFHLFKERERKALVPSKLMKFWGKFVRRNNYKSLDRISVTFWENVKENPNKSNILFVKILSNLIQLLCKVLRKFRKIFPEIYSVKNCRNFKKMFLSYSHFWYYSKLCSFVRIMKILEKFYGNFEKFLWRLWQIFENLKKSL